MRPAPLLLLAALSLPAQFADFAAKLRPLTPNIVTAIEWLPKSNRFWYSRTTPAGAEYILADTAGTKQPAFDHHRLAQALSALEGETVNPARLNLTIQDIQPNTLTFLRANVRYELTLANYALKKLPRPGPLWSAGPRVVEATNPIPAPDGKSELFLQNFNVWLRLKADPKNAKPLTTDGSEGNYYTLSPQAWSPDSSKIAVYRVRPGLRRKIHYVESAPSSQLQPRPKEIPYAKPGDALDIPQPVLIDPRSQTTSDIPNALFPNPYALSRLAWRKDSRAFTFEYNQRGHQAYRVIEVDAATARPRAIVNEEAKTFFCYYSKLFREDVNDGAETIWMSERDGWNHLYLYDGKTGTVKNQITKGPWPVRSVAAVDPAKRQIYFLASGIDPGQDPYYRHLFRVDFDGRNLTRLTHADADHDAQIAPDFSHFTVFYSNPARPTVAELRRLPENTLAVTLEQASDAALRQSGWRPPEVFTSKARDGQTDIWGLIYKPANFDPAKKYPVLEFIYAGPHDSFVPKRFTPPPHLLALAAQGLIVVQIDGMGTSNRSKAFHDVAWKNLKDAGFPDRILWHKAVAAKYPWYDLDRLGVAGHSAGGQNALGALLFHGDFYKVAVASAGCHDNRMDKISWNEQWMGWPVGPEYAASSNVEHAAKLQGKLFLAVGELDTNVDPASTYQVVNSLVKAGKDFDLLVLPGADHGNWGAYWERRMVAFLTTHLRAR